MEAIETLKLKLGYLRSDERQCDEHGPYLADVYMRNGAEFFQSCPTCMQAVLAAETVDMLERNRIEAEQNALAKVFDRAAIPERFASRRLDNYDAPLPGQQHALKFCRLYAERFGEVLESGRSVIFCGSQGTGKTHLSIGIVHEIIPRGYTALYSTVSGAVRRIRASWGSKDETEREAMALFTKPDLLILDEVGVQTGTDNEYTLIFDIINGRYESTKPTIILSNLPVKDVKDSSGAVTMKGLETFIGSRLLDRLRENGGKAFSFDWESHRGRE